MLLQPTSPLRTADDIDAAVQLALSSGCDSVISVREAAQHPFKMFCLDKDESMELLTITNPNFQKVQCSAVCCSAVQRLLPTQSSPVSAG